MLKRDSKRLTNRSSEMDTFFSIYIEEIILFQGMNILKQFVVNLRQKYCHKIEDYREEKSNTYEKYNILGTFSLFNF